MAPIYPGCSPSIFQMESQAGEADRPAVVIEARIADELKVRAQLQSQVPREVRQLHAVIHFKNLFRRVVKPPVIEQETCAASREVLAMRRREALDRNPDAKQILAARPVR